MQVLSDVMSVRKIFKAGALRIDFDILRSSLSARSSHLLGY